MSVTKNKIGSGLSSKGLSDLKKRILIVLLAIVIYRLGAYIPVPGIDPLKLASLFKSNSTGLLGMFNMFSGGALQRMTIFALGVMPYISASIIMQLYTSVSPDLKRLQREGEAGRQKVTQYTRFATVAIGAVQSFGVAKWLASSGVVVDVGMLFYLTAVLTLITGTMFLMWLGEQVTERGIGNGISLLIFASIVSHLPASVGRLFLQVRQGQMQVISLLLLVALIVLIVMAVVYMETAQRRIPISYAKRQQGRRLVGGQNSHLPLKINMAGVIPVIFAQSVILVPGFLAKMFSTIPGFSWLNHVALALSFGSIIYVFVFAAAIIFFSFFYTALTYNPKETADNLKKQGAFIPGIRPGEQTAKYIDKIMGKLTLVGALYLSTIALFPQFLMQAWHVPFYFGGTSLLIVVVVVMDFSSQIQSHLMSNQYQSWMKKSKGQLVRDTSE